MKYDKPIMEILEFYEENVICTSTLVGEGSGDEGGTDGPWAN